MTQKPPVDTRLETIAQCLRYNEFDYEDCLLSAVHTYKTLVAHGYPARILYGELYDIAAPHWWTEAVIPKESTIAIATENSCDPRHQVHTIYTVEPRIRTDEYPAPAVTSTRPDNYQPYPHDSEKVAIRKGMRPLGDAASCHNDSVITEQQPDLAESPEKTLAGPHY